MTKAKEVLALCAALTDRRELAAYTERSAGLINILQQELARFSEDAEPGGGHEGPHLVRSENDPVGLDDFLCRSVLPYGLAALLLSEEDPVMSAAFLSRYELMKAEARASAPAELGVSEDLYGIEEFKGVNAW